MKQKPLSPAERLMVLHRHRGLLQRVAQRCEVHPSLVSKVFHGGLVVLAYLSPY